MKWQLQRGGREHDSHLKGQRKEFCIASAKAQGMKGKNGWERTADIDQCPTQEAI